ncbi:1,4-alpha-glucan branching enzyme [Phenylobacterium soli]|uniref:1,4-alpha-glucan branching enzyme GlgB n=2 Tax=Phenylobacterium soli TaxID=2170551 RepID=A0A328AS01_9CAUL|nr:1,4-alpha-glucan branching enzyme [Phenylobacterium soli]
MVIRAFVPGAERLTARLADGRSVELAQRHPDGLFEGAAAEMLGCAYVLEAERGSDRWSIEDAYRFGPLLGPTDDHLLVEGSHRRLWERLGAHPVSHDGVEGVRFAVWAPNASRVSVVGDFNQWDGRRAPMRKRLDSGVWEIFLPGVAEGARYKFEILDAAGDLLPLKADPFGFSAELRPATASVVARVDDFQWTDAAYLAARSQGAAHRKPISIYEAHLGSWRRNEEGGFLSYDELAATLIPYAAGLGYTHIELLPISEHPLDASWGYQPVGLFAPTRRFGDPAGFARFVDAAHAAGLGVILDWPAAHFPVDAHGLYRFDGTPLYEDADERRGFHPDWNTAIFDFGRREVANVLIANALYWLEVFHVDGLRVDAVASMLHLDYSRQPGEWAPNVHGGRENLEAEAFLKALNTAVYAAHPDVLMIAEESTTWPGVSRPVHQGGLGFGFKWNMGWMNDTLRYISREPVHRRHHHRELTFGLLYAFTETFILPLSHDEVVHGKGSILGRMPGDDWRRFAGLRAYYGFMWGYPGKKLLFMGQEFGQWAEWNFDGELDWNLLQYAPHQGVRRAVADLNRLYRETAALHVGDAEPEGFRWLVVDDEAQSVAAWLRRGDSRDPPVAVVCNFTPVTRGRYRIGLPHAGVWREVFNSDAAEYGGSGHGNLGSVVAIDEPSHGFPASADIELPPLATVYFQYAPDGAAT